MRWVGLMLGLTVGTAQAADLELAMAEAKRVAAAMLPIDGSTARLVIGGLVPGRYAVSVIHDQNGNGKLDTNLVGLPTEGYGFSRDARGTIGPPGFEAAAFDLPAAGAKQIIKLGY
jgi:uncharacterized protein (DUF2141 family)